MSKTKRKSRLPFLSPHINLINYTMTIPISFILPIHNSSDYLTDSIESILAQPIQKEIILVDDGSSDNSLDISLNYAKKYPFIYVIHSQNKGVSNARNLGLKIAQGEYVLFLDPDDIIDSSADLSEMYQLGKQNNIDVIKGLFQVSKPSINLKPELVNPIHEDVKGNIGKIYSLNEALELSCLGSCFIQIGCLIIKKLFIDKHNIQFNKNLCFAEDICFILDLLSSNGLILEIPSLILHYKVRDKGAMSNINEKSIKSLSHAIDLIKNKTNDTKNKKLAHYLQFACAIQIIQLHKHIESSEHLKKQFPNIITQDLKEIVINLNNKGLKYLE